MQRYLNPFKNPIFARNVTKAALAVYNFYKKK